MINYTADQIALQDYITAANVKSRAWMAEAEGRMAGILPDVGHWIKSGIGNVEQFEHYMAVESYINIYKDIHGIKPRWELDNLNNMSAEQVQYHIDKMLGHDMESIEREAHALNNLSTAVGQSVDTIIRWQEQEEAN